MRVYRWGIVMESEKFHLTGCMRSVRLRDGMGVGILKSPSQFFLPLEGGGPEVGHNVDIHNSSSPLRGEDRDGGGYLPLTPTLSSFGKLRTVSLSNPHGGEREIVECTYNRVRDDKLDRFLGSWISKF